MKKLILLLGMLLIGFTAFAQQDSHYSMYMFNGYVLNPAYAGSREQVSATLLHRMQWVGMSNGPRTTSFSIHGPSKDLRHGFGLTAVNDRIGPIGRTDVSAGYAFRIPMGKKANLALGLDATLTNYRTGLSDLNLVGRDPNTGSPVNVSDPSFSNNDMNRWFPNFGTGAYFNTDRFYLGVSYPRLLNQRLYSEDITADSSMAQQRGLLFATAGIVFDLGPSVKFKPSTLMKKTRGTGYEFDLNASFLFKEKLWLGVSYRTEDALVFIAEVQPTPALRIGYAYDRTLTSLNQFSNGSHELMIGFDFSFLKSQMVSPRLF